MARENRRVWPPPEQKERSMHRLGDALARRVSSDAGLALARLRVAFAKVNHAIANSHEDGNVERAALMEFREEVRAILDDG